VRKNFSQKPRKNFSLREKNGEEFSHMGRRGEKWEKIWEKNGRKGDNFSHIRRR